MVKRLNNIKYLEKNSKKYQYLTQIQESIKLDFIYSLVDLNEFDKEVKFLPKNSSSLIGKTYIAKRFYIFEII